MYDVLIIGAGVTGSAIARELSRYKLSVAVLEKEEDVCCGTSKANSAIIHAGFDAATGSLMAKLNVQGNEMMGKLAEELDFPFKRNGSFVVCTREEDMPNLKTLYERGIANGVKDLSIITGEEAKELEPNLADEVVAALWAKTGGIVCPFHMNIAMAENAAMNGVEFRFDTEVMDIVKTEDGFRVVTNRGDYATKLVVNAAGVYADVFHNMVSEKKIHITPRKGEYMLLDKSAGSHVSRTIFQVPGVMGKGILVTPTIHGNLLVGPTAQDTEDKEGTNTTAAGLDTVREKCSRSVKNIPLRSVITSFAGLRAHEDAHEFVIGEAEDCSGFFDAAGIESPGLTSAPAIGVMVAEMVAKKLEAPLDPDFNGKRKAPVNPAELSFEERAALIRENPAYGNIICRCESVSEGEILDAIRRPLGARSLDGVKRRTRAGMGRCQSGFCAPKTMQILERELGIGLPEVTKSGEGSYLVNGKVKENLGGAR